MVAFACRGARDQSHHGGYGCCFRLRLSIEVGFGQSRHRLGGPSNFAVRRWAAAVPDELFALTRSSPSEFTVGIEDRSMSSRDIPAFASSSPMAYAKELYSESFAELRRSVNESPSSPHHSIEPPKQRDVHDDANHENEEHHCDESFRVGQLAGELEAHAD